MTQDRWDFEIRSAWLIGNFMMPAFHDPKKFPKTPESFFRDPNAKQTPAEMLKVLESLTGDYGNAKPPK